MTSTNDGKDVKSNQTSGHKSKSYYIELYTSLEKALSGGGSLEERTAHVCEAWRRVYSLYQHSASSTHPHLLSWLQRHTANTVLQPKWAKSKNEQARLTEAIDALVAEATAVATGREQFPWEKLLLQRAAWFRKAVENPWDNPVLKSLINPNSDPVTDQQVLEWLISEHGIVLVTRLQRMVCAGNCDDLALLLASAVMDRARASLPHRADDRADDRVQEEDPSSFVAVLERDASFTADEWEMLTDIELVLLLKTDKHLRCIELAKLTPLRHGYKMVERLRKRLETFPRDKKLWKHAKDVATIVAQSVITRCMVLSSCTGAGREALYWCARALARLVAGAALPDVCTKLLKHAASARHLHTFTAALSTECKELKTDVTMKPFICELYFRTITTGMDELQQLKLDAEKASEARLYEQTLAGWFTQLGERLTGSARLRAECALTAFSMHPARKHYERVANMAPPKLPQAEEPTPETQTTSEYGSWANDSRTKSNLVKTSETLQLKQSQQHKANVLSTAILTEGEALGLGTVLSQDLAVLLSGPRVKTLSWDMDREVLLENCRSYMEKTHGGTRAVTTELRFLNLDPNAYRHLPEEGDDETDLFYGIEKGYEHEVLLEEPEDIWQNGFFDPEQTESANDSEVDKEMKKKNKALSSEDDEDPLSNIAEAKREKKKLAKERRKKSHKRDGSKDGSRERRKDKDKKTKKERKKDKSEHPTIGSLTSLLGMKVTKISAQVQDGEKRVRKKKERRREPTTMFSYVSVTDSDYDSQGKSSQVTDHDPNVLIDGVFSMDEIRSPERTADGQKAIDNTDIIKNNATVQSPVINDIKTRPMSSPRVSTTSEDSDVSRARSPYLTPNQLGPKHVVSSKVKSSITKLLQYRKKSKPQVRDVPRPPPPTTPTHSLVGMKIYQPEEVPKLHLNKNQSVQLEVLAKDLINEPSSSSANYRAPETDKLPNQNLYNTQKYLQQCSPHHMQNVYNESQKHSEYTQHIPVRPPQQNISSQSPNSVIHTNYSSPIKTPEHIRTRPLNLTPPKPTMAYQPFHKSMQNLSTETKSDSPKKPQLINDPNYFTQQHLKSNSSQLSPRIISNTCVKPPVQTPNIKQYSPSVKDNTKSPQTYSNLYGIYTPRAQTNSQMPESKNDFIKYGQKQLSISMQNISESGRYDTKSHIPTPNTIHGQVTKSSVISHNYPSSSQALYNSNSTASRCLPVQHRERVDKAPQKSNKRDDFEDYVKELMSKISANNGHDKDLTIALNKNVKMTPVPSAKRVDSVTPQSAKQLIQQKKTENAPNTFARRSYMHKNKQSEKQVNLTDAISMELNRTILDQKITKSKCMKNEVTISRVGPKIHSQNIVRKLEQPCSRLQKDCPVLSSILDSTGTPKIQTIGNASQNTSGNLANREDADLLLLLRNQSILKPNVSTIETLPSDVTSGPTSNNPQIRLEISSAHSGLVGTKVKNINILEASPEKRESEENKSLDWKRVMDAIIAQKTEPLGPNALDLVLKKDYRRHSQSSRSHSSDKLRMSGQTSHNKPSEPKNRNNSSKVSSSRKPSTEKHLDVTKKPREHEIKNTTTQMLRPEDQKHYTQAIPKVVSQTTVIPNTDYDILDDLLDDDLRREIGEISSDEETNTPNAALPKGKAQSTIPKTGSNVYKATNNAKVKPHIVPKTIPKNETNMNIVDCNRRFTVTCPTGYPNVINNTSHPTHIENKPTNPEIMRPHTATSTIITNQVAQDTANNIVTSNMESNHFVSNVIPANVIIASVPPPPVVVIRQDLVYDPYPTIRIHESQVNTELCTINQRMYALNPNFALYQTTQYAAPVINPVIIGNAMTTTNVTMGNDPASPDCMKDKQDEDSISLEEAIRLTDDRNDTPKISSKSLEDVIRLSEDRSQKPEMSTNLDFNMNRNCERKVLSQVQEKHPNDVDKDLKKSPIVSPLKIDEDRIKLKRQSLMNRKISQAKYPPIPLTYTPLTKIVNLEKQLQQETTKNGIVKSNLKSKPDNDIEKCVVISTSVKSPQSEANNENIESTNQVSSAKENQKTCRRIWLRSSNKILNKLSPVKRSRVPLRRNKIKLKENEVIEKAANLKTGNKDGVKNRARVSNRILSKVKLIKPATNETATQEERQQNVAENHELIDFEAALCSSIVLKTPTTELGTANTSKQEPEYFNVMVEKKLANAEFSAEHKHVNSTEDTKVTSQSNRLEPTVVIEKLKSKLGDQLIIKRSSIETRVKEAKVIVIKNKNRTVLRKRIIQKCIGTKESTPNKIIIKAAKNHQSAIGLSVANKANELKPVVILDQKVIKAPPIGSPVVRVETNKLVEQKVNDNNESKPVGDNEIVADQKLTKQTTTVSSQPVIFDQKMIKTPPLGSPLVRVKTNKLVEKKVIEQISSAVDDSNESKPVAYKEIVADKKVTKQTTTVGSQPVIFNQKMIKTPPIGSSLVRVKTNKLVEQKVIEQSSTAVDDSNESKPVADNEIVADKKVTKQTTTVNSQPVIFDQKMIKTPPIGWPLVRVKTNKLVEQKVIEQFSSAIDDSSESKPMTDNEIVPDKKVTKQATTVSSRPAILDQKMIKTPPIGSPLDREIITNKVVEQKIIEQISSAVDESKPVAANEILAHQKVTKQATTVSSQPAILDQKMIKIPPMRSPLVRLKTNKLIEQISSAVDGNNESKPVADNEIVAGQKVTKQATTISSQPAILDHKMIKTPSIRSPLVRVKTNKLVEQKVIEQISSAVDGNNESMPVADNEIVADQKVTKQTTSVSSPPVFEENNEVNPTVVSEKTVLKLACSRLVIDKGKILNSSVDNDKIIKQISNFGVPLVKTNNSTTVEDNKQTFAEKLPRDLDESNKSRSKDDQRTIKRTGSTSDSSTTVHKKHGNDSPDCNKVSSEIEVKNNQPQTLTTALPLGNEKTCPTKEFPQNSAMQKQENTIIQSKRSVIMSNSKNSTKISEDTKLNEADCKPTRNQSPLISDTVNVNHSPLKKKNSDDIIDISDDVSTNKILKPTSKDAITNKDQQMCAGKSLLCQENMGKVDKEDAALDIRQDGQQILNITEAPGKEKQTYMKGDIKIQELPVVASKDPHMKLVRITLPNGKAFRATIRGKMEGDFDSLFADPAMRSILAGSTNDGKRYTVNYKQVRKANRSNPSKILGTQIQDLNIQEAATIDTVNLISDDEDEVPTLPSRSFITEFGKYSTNLDEKTFTLHQHRFNQKCEVKMHREDIFKSNKTKPKRNFSSEGSSLLTRNKSKLLANVNAPVEASTTTNIIPEVVSKTEIVQETRISILEQTNSTLKDDTANIIEIDDSSNDSIRNATPTSDGINLEPVKKLVELKGLLLHDLGVGIDTNVTFPRPKEKAVGNLKSALLQDLGIATTEDSVIDITADDEKRAEISAHSQKQIEECLENHPVDVIKQNEENKVQIATGIQTPKPVDDTVQNDDKKSLNRRQEQDRLQKCVVRLVKCDNLIKKYEYIKNMKKCYIKLERLNNSILKATLPSSNENINKEEIYKTEEINNEGTDEINQDSGEDFIEFDVEEPSSSPRLSRCPSLSILNNWDDDNLPLEISYPSSPVMEIYDTIAQLRNKLKTELVKEPEKVSSLSCDSEWTVTKFGYRVQEIQSRSDIPAYINNIMPDCDNLMVSGVEKLVLTFNPPKLLTIVLKFFEDNPDVIYRLETMRSFRRIITTKTTRNKLKRKTEELVSDSVASKILKLGTLALNSLNSCIKVLDVIRFTNIEENMTVQPDTSSINIENHVIDNSLPKVDTIIDNTEGNTQIDDFMTTSDIVNSEPEASQTDLVAECDEDVNQTIHDGFVNEDINSPLEETMLICPVVGNESLSNKIEDHYKEETLDTLSNQLEKNKNCTQCENDKEYSNPTMNVAHVPEQTKSLENTMQITDSDTTDDKAEKCKEETQDSNQCDNIEKYSTPTVAYASEDTNSSEDTMQITNFDTTDDQAEKCNEKTQDSNQCNDIKEYSSPTIDVAHILEENNSSEDTMQITDSNTNDDKTEKCKEETQDGNQCENIKECSSPSINFAHVPEETNASEDTIRITDSDTSLTDDKAEKCKKETQDGNQCNNIKGYSSPTIKVAHVYEETHSLEDTVPISDANTNSTNNKTKKYTEEFQASKSKPENCKTDLHALYEKHEEELKKCLTPAISISLVSEDANVCSEDNAQLANTDMSATDNKTKEEKPIQSGDDIAMEQFAPAHGEVNLLTDECEQTKINDNTSTPVNDNLFDETSNTCVPSETTSYDDFFTEDNHEVELPTQLSIEGDRESKTSANVNNEQRTDEITHLVNIDRLDEIPIDEIHHDVCEIEVVDTHIDDGLDVETLHEKSHESVSVSVADSSDINRQDSAIISPVFIDSKKITFNYHDYTKQPKKKDATMSSVICGEECEINNEEYVLTKECASETGPSCKETPKNYSEVNASENCPLKSSPKCKYELFQEDDLLTVKITTESNKDDNNSKTVLVGANDAEDESVASICSDLADDMDIKGFEFEDIYVFPLNQSAGNSNNTSNDSVGQETNNKNLNDTVQDDLHDIDFHVIEPEITYSRKRKVGMRDIRVPAKKYRKGKNIDCSKQTTISMAELAYGKEYKRLLEYCSSVKFSYTRPFHKECIEVDDLMSNWPIKNVNCDVPGDTVEPHLFVDMQEISSYQPNPMAQTFIEEINYEYESTDATLGKPSSETNEVNFNMGFGEGSGRVIQILKKGESNISAATLSDVKQSQPVLKSVDLDDCNDVTTSKDDQIKKIRQHVNFIELRDKVRTFFKKTSVELKSDWLQNTKNEDFESKCNDRCSAEEFPFDLCSLDYLKPVPTNVIVQVVQVGQLPVSAAAQNPVTCDPRVTQVSDASPSQCSVDNSPNDDSQSEIKTEYTELTTADLSLPLQGYAQQNQANLASNDSNVELTEQTISLEMEIKAEESPVIKEEMPDIKEEKSNSSDTDLHTLTNSTPENMNYSFENTRAKSDASSAAYDASEQNSSETFSQQRPQNGTTEKTDQIAHAMNAAGITTTPETVTNTRAHALVNILSQKIRQGSVNTTQTTTNTYSKTTSINAMALQQALAQILPPPLNQTGSSENNQSQSTPVGPQVLHIVQGKNASGNQITLVDNSQQSVINTSNATQVLHIVQNKNATPGQASNGTLTPQTNSYSGLSLVDAGLQQGGNQLLHIVNTGNQKTGSPGQLLKRVNLLTNLANVQGSNEQKMVQFVCKSADGKAIQLNAPHQRSMVLRLQPIETPNVQTPAAKPAESQEPSPSSTGSASNKESASQQEIKSRSIYEENYAKFIQNSSSKTPGLEKSTSLPKFNQAFGKPVFQEGQKQNEAANNNTHLPAVNTNNENAECPATDNAINLEHIGQISSPPLLLRKQPVVTSASQPNIVQQIKQTIAPMNIQTMHGGVIYTRQIPVNIGGGQTINLITVPSTELINDDSSKTQAQSNHGEIEPSIIKIVPQSQTTTSTESTQEESNNHASGSNENAQTPQPQPVLTQMRIKLPMLSKAPQMVPGARVVRPSFFQIQRNVIGGANQPVYQQLVLTAAPPLGQQTIRLPQAQTSRPVSKAPSESQSSSSESQMSTSTLEQLREFDMVLEQVKERSTVQPSTNSNNTSFKIHTTSSDTTDGNGSSNCSTESTPQVLYSIGNNQSLNVTYVNRKTNVTTPTTSTYVRSPDSSGIADSPTSSTHVQIPHTVTTDSSPTEMSSQSKQAKVGSKSKSRPKSTSNPPNTLKLNSVPPKTSSQKPLEDEQTTQRILYILAEYKEQVENSPDKDKPAPRRRSNPPSNPGSSKRKKSSSSRRSGTRDMSPIHGEDTCRTMGSEDSSCGTSQGDCTESCLDSHSPQDSPRKVARKITFDQDITVTQPRPQPQRNVIVADGQTITVARGTTGKPATAVLMPANYILPVSMVKGGQQIAIVTNRGPKLLTVGGEGGATNALLLQRLIGPAGLKPVLARPGVRHVRLPTAALHNLQAFNLATATTVPPPDSTASPTPGPTPPELVDTRATSSPWTDREDVKPERGSSPEGSEPWNLPSSADAHDYTYEETVRTDNMDRTVLDQIPDRYSPDMEAQRIFDKMFDVDSKKSYAVDSHDDSPRCAYDIDPSDCDDKAYQVVQKKDGSQRQHRLSHVSAAALRHKYAILEHELRLQKSLSEECEDLGVDSPSASELFPEAELLFAASPAHEHNQEHHSHTPQPLQSSIPQPDMDDQIATDHLIPREIDMSGLGDVGIVAVSEDGSATIALDQEEFARSHPNTTFHSEPTEGEVQPFTITGLKGRHITSTIFHSNSAPATVLMTAPQATVISQAPEHSVKYEIENMINSMPSSHNNDINLSSVLVKDDGLTRFDNILTDSRELHLTNTTSAIVHSSGNATQVIRRVCYEDDKRERDARYLIDEPDNLIAGDDAKMIAEDSSRDATLESMADVDDDRSSPERHAELFWESNSASERSESRRPLDFSSDSDKCCKSPYDETNSTDSSGVGTHMRLDSVIKEARGRERSGSAEGSSADDGHPPLRTYPPKRMYHPLEGVERSLSGKTRAGESPDLEVRRRASGRGVVKRGCHCCNGSPAPPKKKPRQRKPTLDFNATN